MDINIRTVSHKPLGSRFLKCRWLTNKCVLKQPGMSRSAHTVTLLICSLQIPHALDWEALDAMTKNNVTCGTGGSQWGDDEDYSVEGRDDILCCGHWSSP